MLLKGSDIRGMKVISKQDGKQIDTVKDILYSSDKQRVVGFLLSEELLSNGARYIEYADVASIGQDAIMIDTAQAVKDGAKDRVSGMKGKDMFVGKEVVTENGNHVGKISDVCVDTESGSIAQFDISEGLLEDLKGGKKNMEAGQSIMKIGTDTILVKDSVQQRVASQPDTGGLTGMFEKAKEKGQQAYQGAQAKAQDMKAPLAEKEDQYHKEKTAPPAGSVQMNDMVDYEEQRHEPPHMHVAPQINETASPAPFIAPQPPTMTHTAPAAVVAAATATGPHMATSSAMPAPPAQNRDMMSDVPAGVSAPIHPVVPPIQHSGPTATAHDVHDEVKQYHAENNLYYDINELSEQTRSVTERIKHDADTMQEFVDEKVAELKDRAK
jgi:uncharacterized protein YrrD